MSKHSLHTVVSSISFPFSYGVNLTILREAWVTVGSPGTKQTKDMRQ